MINITQLLFKNALNDGDVFKGNIGIGKLVLGYLGVDDTVNQFF
jgi:hypothetical protein